MAAKGGGGNLCGDGGETPFASARERRTVKFGGGKKKLFSRKNYPQERVYWGRCPIEERKKTPTSFLNNTGISEGKEKRPLFREKSYQGVKKITKRRVSSISKKALQGGKAEGERGRGGSLSARRTLLPPNKRKGTPAARIPFTSQGSSSSLKKGGGGTLQGGVPYFL